MARGDRRKSWATVAGTVVVASFAAAAAPLAQSPKPPMTDEAYVNTMKEIQRTFRSLQINNKAMNHTDGAREARRLAGWFGDVQMYWDNRKVQDAAQFAKTAVLAARQIESASTTMDMTQLAAAEKTLASTCQGCHTSHREQMPDGTFRIK
jgi:hypothetical protein